ncbi:MAG TPA: MarR family transcriptional regulator [Terracidiphilus sp.]|jgi:DNA-binding MarR family transcriptional regulator
MAREISTSAEDLADRLHSAAIHLLRRLRREDDASGLNAPRLSALSVIVFAGPVTLGDLARAEQVRPPTMTRIVDALVELRLVTKRPHPDDKRSTLIAATAAGRKLLMAGRERRVHALSRQIAALSPADEQQLRSAVEILNRTIAAI